MHNRAPLVTASFPVKDVGLPGAPRCAARTSTHPDGSRRHGDRLEYCEPLVDHDEAVVAFRRRSRQTHERSTT